MTLRSILTLLLAAPFLLTACDSPPETDAEIVVLESDTLAVADGIEQDPADLFFDNIAALCGQAFAGEIAESTAATDTTFAGHELVMHVRECEDNVLYVPFHVGENRSRTWIITRTEDGLQLKHDHRHEDGTDEELTMYGGDTADPGTANVQEFIVDQETIDMLPATATNVWTVEIHPGESFHYALRREGTDRRFRVVFDITQPIDPPPAPWGWE